MCRRVGSRGASLRFRAVTADVPRDLASLVVPRCGAVVATGEVFEPFRLVDGTGIVVGPAAVFLRDLQACGRSASTLRSYGMDLLRWFRFVWAIEISWDRATAIEARDFCCWIQLVDKPTGPHWRRLAGGRAAVRSFAGVCPTGASAGSELGDRQTRPRCQVRGKDGGALRDGVAWLL